MIENWINWPGPENVEQWHEVHLEASNPGLKLSSISFNIFINDLTMGQNTFSENTLSATLIMIQNWEERLTQESRAAIQRDLSKLEK